MWFAVELLDNEHLARAAKARANARLRNGRIARLILWPSSRSHNSGRYVRLETTAGRRFTVHVSEVEAVEVSDGTA